MVLEAARFADRHDFTSVWVPERHYTHFGGLFPNPVVLQAALARETRRIRLMAGSVVMPLPGRNRAWRRERGGAFSRAQGGPRLQLGAGRDVALSGNRGISIVDAAEDDDDDDDDDEDD